MVQKKLEKNSTHNDLDLDGDGVVSDAEIAASEALYQHGGHRTTAEAITGFRIQPGTGTFISGLFILSRRKIA